MQICDCCQCCCLLSACRRCILQQGTPWCVQPKGMMHRAELYCKQCSIGGNVFTQGTVAIVNISTKNFAGASNKKGKYCLRVTIGYGTMLQYSFSLWYGGVDVDT